MKRQLISTGLALGLLVSLPGLAFAQELALGGQVVGIQISTRGVLVAGVGAVETAEGSRAPAREAGVREGDFVVAVNGREVDSASELIAAVGEREGESVELSLLPSATRPPAPTARWATASTMRRAGGACP